MSVAGVCESRDVAGELLEEVLDEVVGGSPWGAAARADRLGSFRSVEEGPHFDLCRVCWEQLPSAVMSGCSLLRGRVEVLQLRTAEQQASGYCGHYALFFCLCCVEASLSDSLEDTVTLLRKTSSVGDFWRRYWLTVGRLLGRVRGEEELWWPWTDEHILSGDMERSYLLYLLNSDPHCLALDSSKITVLHYAYGCIQNSWMEVDEIQRKIDVFRSSAPPTFLPFILGVTNHWVFLLAYKVGHSDWGSKVGVLYLDSNNVCVLGASDSDLAGTVKEKERERVKRKGQGYSEWKRGVIYQAFVDQRDLVQLLAQCVVGENELCSVLVTGHWTKLLDSYQTLVERREKEEEGYILLLLQWLESHYHPRTIINNHITLLRALGTAVMGEELKERVSVWVRGCWERLCPGESGIDTVDLFWTALTHLTELGVG